MNEILDLVKRGRVFEIDRKLLGDELMTQEEMLAIFNYFGAFWQYSGEPNPEKPHALLKSGKHSNGFISCQSVLKYPLMCKLFSYEVYKKVLLYKTTYGLSEIDAVAASAYSALDLGYEVARRLAKNYPGIESIKVEKDTEGNPTTIRGGIDSSKNVLVVNELMTTKKGSTWETRLAALNANGPDKPQPNVIIPSFVLVHRSKDLELFDGSKVIPVFHFDMTDWNVPEGEECPYCNAGSEAIKPKVGNNWNIIHGRV
jgi:orotate phosphoribosyltransferase